MSKTDMAIWSISIFLVASVLLSSRYGSVFHVLVSSGVTSVWCIGISVKVYAING